MIELSLQLYKKMYLIRRVEELIQTHYAEDEMKTPMHMSMGEEAIVCAVCHALRSSDQVLGTYRSHGIYLAKTMECEKFFGEMYGKATGTAMGKAGSMHLFAPEASLICTSAIVGSHIPVAVGAAFANQIHGNGKTVAVFFGDGAIDEGAFWESLNIACLKRLPLFFVCEDNGFAVHSPAGERHGYKNIASIVENFNCKVYSSESTDVEELYRICCQAKTDIEAGNGPCFLHFKYYRYLEHVGVFEDFKSGYRQRQEFETWLARDPIKTQRERIVAAGGGVELKKLEQEVNQFAEAGLQKAKRAPFPEQSVLLQGVRV